MKASKIAGIIIIAILLLALSANFYSKPKVSGAVVNQAPTAVIKINYNNMASILSFNQVIQSLPSDANILLKFYNFNIGDRQWEKSYLITKGKVVENTASVQTADIILSMSSKYLDQMTTSNFCSVIQTANANRDLGFETTLSKLSLGWKYKSVYTYRSCFGF